MTNLLAVATIVLSTNVTETLHPSGQSKVRVSIVNATVMVPGYVTNTVPQSTNVKHFVWCEVPNHRRPLETKDLLPPMPNPTKGKR